MKREPTIIDKVMEQAQQRAARLDSSPGGLHLSRLNIGIKYLAVELSDGSVGLSFRFPEDPFHLIEDPLSDDGKAAPPASQYSAQPVRTLISWAADNRSLLRSAIGIAVCSALAPWDELEASGRELESQDSAEASAIRDGDIVGMVGFFPPLVKKLEKRNIELRIFERTMRQPHPCLYPDRAENRLLPDCDVVIMTGTACVNGTIDQLLEYCSGARQVSVTGPTAPMYPKAFAGTNATILAGARVREEQKQQLFDAVSHGCCGAETLKFMNKVSYRP